MGKKGAEPVIRETSIPLNSQGALPADPTFRISYQDLSQIQWKLIEGFGLRGGRGIAELSGQASLRYGLRELGESMGLTGLDFRLLPLPRRVKGGLTKMAQVLSAHSDQIITVVEEENAFLWRVKKCPYCWQQQAVEPICNLTSGWLHEYLSWLSGGKYYRVTEIECTACGAEECVHRIDKQPLE